jgi:histidine ammonia-lyase
MGANAATKCYRVIENVERLLAIELLNASQAIEFRRPLKSSLKIEKVLTDFRKLIPFIKDDKIMYQEMEATLQFVKTLSI